jgi:hypothetical protein
MLNVRIGNYKIVGVKGDYKATYFSRSDHRLAKGEVTESLIGYYPHIDMCCTQILHAKLTHDDINDVKEILQAIKDFEKNIESSVKAMEMFK